MGELLLLPPVGEGTAAAVELGKLLIIPGTVFVVAHQGKPPGGELHPDLMTSAGMKPDAYQCGITALQAHKFQPRRFYTGALLFHHKDLVFSAVLK